MSLVTDACLYVNYAPREAEQRLRDPLPFDPRCQAFKKVPWEGSGGHKGMGAGIYLAGFNFVLIDDLVAHLRDVLGDESIAVLVTDTEDDPDIYVFGSEVTVHPHQDR